MAGKYLVATIIGPDRRGIVARISETILARNANIEESHMSRLGGEFAVLMLLSVKNELKNALISSLKTELGEDVHIFIKETDLTRVKVFEGFVPYEISVIGADHEGIVHAVAEYLADVKVQVEDMETHVTQAPLTGTPLFSMDAEVQSPPDIQLSELRENLNALGDELGVDIEIRLPVK